MTPRYFSALWRSRRRSPLSSGTVAQISNADDHFLVSTETDHPVPALTGATHAGSSMSIPALALTGTATRPPSSQGNTKGAVPASSVGVPMVTTSSETTYHLDPSQAKKNVGRIRRFRVLVMGRANAGKTTILQRVCNTTDQPEIFDAEGREVCGMNYPCVPGQSACLCTG
ncbi:hypothetical protein EDD16DRAFT_381002 [Pisolithus croceorrhizus]|nr:hypothetical protein EDD16DRAFT_381002 [Pisolithus croceorrhizus]